MEGVTLRLDQARRAALTLQEALGLEANRLVQDAAIQRFEFTFEATWKAAKAFLLKKEGLDVGTPKSVLRACHQAGLLDSEELKQALLMADDRNLTSHTYDEGVADTIFSRLKDHLALIQCLLERMS